MRLRGGPFIRRTTTDARSGITNDPNREDDPRAGGRLVGQVVRVGVETVGIVRALAALEVQRAASA